MTGGWWWNQPGTVLYVRHVTGWQWNRRRWRVHARLHMQAIFLLHILSATLSRKKQTQVSSQRDQHQIKADSLQYTFEFRTAELTSSSNSKIVEWWCNAAYEGINPTTWILISHQLWYMVKHLYIPYSYGNMSLDFKTQKVIIVFSWKREKQYKTDFTAIVALVKIVSTLFGQCQHKDRQNYLHIK